jgi:hypothetical protein
MDSPFGIFLNYADAQCGHYFAVDGIKVCRDNPVDAPGKGNLLVAA